MLHNVAPTAIEGFAVGVLASAVCALIIIALLLLRRRHSGHDVRDDRVLDEVPGADGDAFSMMSEDDLLLLGTGAHDTTLHPASWSGYVSKHRLASPEADLLSDIPRGRPKHAAPSAVLSSLETEEPATTSS